MTPIARPQQIKDTYIEVEDLEDRVIELQLEFAATIVDKDIKTGQLDEDYRGMAEVYMTCHLLYMNYLKTSEDTLNGNTRDKKLTPKLGMGLQGSTYGQIYLSLKSQTIAMDQDLPVSGVGFLS